MLKIPAVLRFEFRNDGLLKEEEEGLRVIGTATKDAIDRNNANRMELALEPYEGDPKKFLLLITCVSDRSVTADVAMIVRGNGQGVADSPQRRCVREAFADDRLSSLTFCAHKAKTFILPTSLLQLHNGVLKIDLVLQYARSDIDEPFRPENQFNANMLNLFISGELADGWFKVGDTVFPVHKAILHANNEFNKDMIPHSSTVEEPLVIETTSPDNFKFILRWAYGSDLDHLEPGMGEVPLVLDKGKEIIATADFFGVGSLKMAVEAVLVKNLALDGKNAISYLDFAHTKCCYSLKEMTMKYVVARVEDLWDKIPVELHKEVAMAMSKVIGRARRFAFEGHSVDWMRRELGKRALDYDGSPEALQARLNESDHKRARTTEVVDLEGEN